MDIVFTKASNTVRYAYTSVCSIAERIVATVKFIFEYLGFAEAAPQTSSSMRADPVEHFSVSDSKSTAPAETEPTPQKPVNESLSDMIQRYQPGIKGGVSQYQNLEKDEQNQFWDLVLSSDRCFELMSCSDGKEKLCIKFIQDASLDQVRCLIENLNIDQLHGIFYNRWVAKKDILINELLSKNPDSYENIFTLIIALYQPYKDKEIAIYRLVPEEQLSQFWDFVLDSDRCSELMTCFDDRRLLFVKFIRDASKCQVERLVKVCSEGQLNTIFKTNAGWCLLKTSLVEDLFSQIPDSDSMSEKISILLQFPEFVNQCWSNLEPKYENLGPILRKTLLEKWKITTIYCCKERGGHDLPTELYRKILGMAYPL